MKREKERERGRDVSGKNCTHYSQPIYLNLFFRVGEHKTGWRSSLLFGKDKTRQSRQVGQTISELSFGNPIYKIIAIYLYFDVDCRVNSLNKKFSWLNYGLSNKI